MALSITSLKRDVSGNKRLHAGKLTFDNSYPTGGESLTPANIGLHVIENITIISASGLTFEYDYTNQKVKAFSALSAHNHTLHFQTAAAANSVTAATNALRTAAAAFDVAGVANSSGEGGIVTAAPTTTLATNTGQEVANTTDLSSISARFIAIGY